MSNRLKTTLISLLLPAFICLTAAAAPDKANDLATPQVPARQKVAVADYMRREGQALIKMGYRAEKERQGEVIVVTLPAAQLFAPNDTTLMPAAHKLLQPFMAYMEHPDRFKIVVTTHTDDTGSPGYKEWLTNARLDALMAFIAANAVHPEVATGYAMADDEPLATNANRAGRAINRRVELYIVPDQGLLQRLKKK